MSIVTIFAEKVKSFRKLKGISQETLADMAGLDRTYISGIEKGKRNVSIETVEKLSQALNVRVRDFFE